MTRNPRGIVLDNLIEINEEHSPSHIVVKESLDQYYSLSRQDRAFIKRLTIGTLEHLTSIDEIIDRYSSVPVTKQKPVIRNIIRSGVYQLLYTEVNAPSACNESVNLCKKYGFAGLAGFVNGVMRTVARNKDALVAELDCDINASADKLHALCFKYSMPEWIAKYFLDNYGLEKTVAVFDFFFKDNPVTICCNQSNIEQYKLEALLKAKVESVTTIEDMPKCMRLSGYDSLVMLDEFVSGLFWVQDFSSVLASELPDINMIHEYLNGRLTYDIKVLDLCAAPGGKTINMADRFKVAGLNAHFTACDISESKLALVKDNITRLGFDNIDILKNDATVFKPDFEENFDIVLTDVPCSGLGIIGKKPDIKYNTSPDKQDELVRLQRSILDNAVRYLKTGGYMVYSTCTVNHAENEENVEYIKDKGFEALLTRQLLPGELESDGFFYSLLKKL